MVIKIHQTSIVTFLGIRLWSSLDCDQGGLVLVLVDTLIHINDQILVVKILKIKIENDIWPSNGDGNSIVHISMVQFFYFKKKFLTLNSCHLCWLKFSSNN
jgi:hypothetical protein